MTSEEYWAERERLCIERVKKIIAAGRLEAEDLEKLGHRGSPGFIGRGVYDGKRSAGYLKGGRGGS